MPLSFDHVMRLRLVVARVGEMDCARWWNTRGQLGRMGMMTVARGLPRTHRFARARAVFAVAAARCEAHYSPQGSVTLWRLSPALDEEMEASWGEWLDRQEAWAPLFEQLEAWTGDDLLAALDATGLMTSVVGRKLKSLRVDESGRGVCVPAAELDDDTMTILTAAFSLSPPGDLVVPYVLLPR
jgi:hypothetical protein